MLKNVVVKCPMCESKIKFNEEYFSKTNSDIKFWDCNVCGHHFLPSNYLEKNNESDPFKYIKYIQVCCIAILCGIITYKTTYPIFIRFLLAFVETAIIFSFWSGMKKIYYKN